MTTAPAADLVANEWTALWSAAIPFLLAIVFLLISPLLTEKVEAAVLRQIKESDGKHGVTEDMIPPSRTNDFLNVYIEYAIDAAQAVPLALLPVAGAVFAIATHVPRAIALGYLIIAIVVAVMVNFLVLSRIAGKYVSHRLGFYSLVTVVGIASNLLGLVMILYYGP